MEILLKDVVRKAGTGHVTWHMQQEPRGIWKQDCSNPFCQRINCLPHYESNIKRIKHVEQQ